MLTDKTFIIAGYTIPCNGTVVAWEFCYLVSFSSSETFYPGIWKITGTTHMSTDYALVQSSNVTFDPSETFDANGTFDASGIFNDLYLCRIFIISVKDQFIAPEGSVVGLYSGIGPVLLHTNTDNLIATYEFSGNQSGVIVSSEASDIDYNIAIRVHLGKYSENITIPFCVASYRLGSNLKHLCTTLS